MQTHAATRAMLRSLGDCGEATLRPCSAFALRVFIRRAIQTVTLAKMGYEEKSAEFRRESGSGVARCPMVETPMLLPHDSSVA